MDRTKIGLVGAAVLAAAIGGSVGTAPAGAKANQPLYPKHLSCDGDNYAKREGRLYRVGFHFDAYLYGVVNGSDNAATISVGYRFTNGRKVVQDGPLRVKSIAVAIGGKNNVNITAPISWKSPDNLPSEGTTRVPKFIVRRGGKVQIDAIADLEDMPDSRCTATGTVTW